MKSFIRFILFLPDPGNLYLELYAKELDRLNSLLTNPCK